MSLNINGLQILKPNLFELVTPRKTCNVLNVDTNLNSYTAIAP